MDFTMSLQRTKKHNDSIMMVVDKRSKETHFIPVKSTYKAINIAEFFLRENFSDCMESIRKSYMTDILSLHVTFGRLNLQD